MNAKRCIACGADRYCMPREGCVDVERHLASFQRARARRLERETESVDTRRQIKTCRETALSLGFILVAKCAEGPCLSPAAKGRFCTEHHPTCANCGDQLLRDSGRDSSVGYFCSKPDCKTAYSLASRCSLCKARLRSGQVCKCALRTHNEIENAIFSTQEAADLLGVRKATICHRANSLGVGRLVPAAKTQKWVFSEKDLALIRTTIDYRRASSRAALDSLR